MSTPKDKVMMSTPGQHAIAPMSRCARFCRRYCSPINPLSLLVLLTGLSSFAGLAFAQHPSWEKGISSTAEQCHGVAVQVLGSGGPELDDGRHSSSYIVYVEDEARLLVDVGSGSSTQFGAAGATFDSVDAILLSHLHTDHAADLPSFIKGSFFTKRDKNLTIYGPAGNTAMPSTQQYVEALIGNEGAYRYLSSYMTPGREDYFIETETVGKATLDAPFEATIRDNLSVQAVNVKHGPIPALAWKVSVNGCIVVFSGDTNDKAGTLATLAQNADLLVLHNAIDDHAGDVAKNLHMTPKQLIAIAKASAAKRVLISHIMKRSEPGLQALTEAIAVVAPGRVYAAKDLMTITLQSNGVD